MEVKKKVGQGWNKEIERMAAEEMENEVSIPRWETIDPFKVEERQLTATVDWFLNSHWTASDWTIKTWPMNANLNYYQYWDDSNPAQQWQRWGMNEKYTGEGVKTSNLGYDENIKTSDLDPNYLYWEAAKNRNSKEAWYIARRNDMIASALYNEWLTSREDVANFLSSQNEWMNSTEADRLNTIDSVWKRLWQIKPEETPTPEEEPQADFTQDTSGKIYWKTTADEWNPKQWIDTLADANSVFKAMEEKRTQTVDDMFSLWVDNLAATKYYNTWTYSEQNWRDFSLRYPQTSALVDKKVKEMKAQENVTAISNWWEIVTSADNVDTNVEATSYAVNNTTSTSSATQLLKSIDSILESNDTAKSAQDLMGSIEKDMATLKNRMKNLKTEANNAFKWDVPDYIVNAYINNKSQEIQNQLSILEDRYNAAYNRYKTEMSNAQWQAEYQLKKDSLELDWWKAKNTTDTTSTTSSQDWRMRTERNNNPTAMTTDYAKMMWLELWVDYEIWDSFIWWDWRTYYTARFLWDPVETAIKAFDRWAANNVFANEWWVLWHRHLWISNQKRLSMTDKEKREVIDKILQKEWGKMDNMSYYLNNTANESEKVAYNPAWEDMLRQIATWKVKLNSATAKSYAEMMWTDVRWLWKMVESYQWDQLANWKAAGKDLLNIMAELQILFEDKWLDNWQFDTNAAQSLWWGSIWRKNDQLKEQLKLNKVTEARDKWATFWQMTEYEWKVLENAATSLNILKQSDKEYTDEFKKIMRATWIATFWKAPTEQEWYDYVQQQRAYQSFNVSVKGSSSQTTDDKLAQIGSWNVWTWIDFWDVVTNWK